jgi:hypothetical protein
MMKHLLVFAAIGTTALTAAALPAEARDRTRVVNVQGANGSLVKQRSVSREPGSRAVTRSVQGSEGRGYVSSRGRSVEDGTYTGGRTTTAAPTIQRRAPTATAQPQRRAGP